MKIAKGIFSNIIRPYSEALKGLSQSGEGIKKNAEILSQSVKKDKSNTHYIEAADSKAAFEALYVANEWTPAELAKQELMVKRSKFMMMGFAWVSLLAMLYFFTNAILGALYGAKYLFNLYLAMVFVFTTLIFSLTTIKNALFQEQIKQRDLLTLKQFFESGQLLRKLFR